MKVGLKSIYIVLISITDSTKAPIDKIKKDEMKIIKMGYDSKMNLYLAKSSDFKIYQGEILVDGKPTNF